MGSAGHACDQRITKSISVTGIALPELLTEMFP